MPGGPRGPVAWAWLAALLAASTASLAGGANPSSPKSPLATPAPESTWRRLSSGLSLRKLSPPQAGLELHLVRLDPALHRIAVRHDENGGHFRPLVASGVPGVLAAINGGFFDEQGQPLGWLVGGGKEIHALRKEGWAAFALTRQGATIVRALDAASLSDVEEAVQAGPRLVVAGQPNSLKPQLAVRSFVGLDVSGRIVLGTSAPYPAEANVLAGLLAKSEGEGGAGLVEALNLDGGGSSQLFVKGGLEGGADLLLPGLTGVPNLLVVEAVTP